MASSVTELSDRFPIAGLRFEQGRGGLTKAVVQTPTASGELYLHGAHVTSWQPEGQQPVLWMSRSSNFEAGKPIRGGVPICFPWFGPHPTDSSAPAHGYARITEWELVDAKTTDDDAVGLTLQTVLGPFSLMFSVSFGGDLRMTLQTELAASATAAQSFEVALHTYFSVGDVQLISISGLENVPYVDKVNGPIEKAASGEMIRFFGETDRVYSGTDGECLLADAVRKRLIRVRKSGSRSTVVWNPWINKSARMPDFGDHEWPEMVCIETANVGSDAIQLAPGALHSTAVVVEVEALA